MLLQFRELVNNNSLFHAAMHGIFPIPFAIYLWKKTKSKKSIILMYLATFLIDLDHLVDYFAFYGLRFNFFEFVGGEYFEVTQTAFIPLHAWEWIILLGILAKLYGWKSKYTAILSGVLPHLIFDSFIQNNFLFYSIAFRALNRFSFLW